jgi:pimeloyl-ACP methyl ester carboxylesterase
MNAVVSLVVSALVAAPAGPDTRFVQVAPVYREEAAVQRSASQGRAVVLIPGLRLHPFSGRNVTKAEWHSWQRPDSPLVKALAPEADVFAFAYSQDVPLETVAGGPGLRDGVRRLRALGYREIVLVGHSAGGLVARQLVEDYPDAGVTKVVQACAPNGGSAWAKARVAVRKAQESFLASLTKKDRRQSLHERAAKRIPADVEFVCVVARLQLPLLGPREKGAHAGHGLLRAGDGIVSAVCQWTPELQEQGIPAVALSAGHSGVVHGRPGIDVITRLVREHVLRWDAAAVAAARQRILGDEKPKR